MMTTSELSTALEDHVKWLARTGGKRADFRRANLRGAVLSGVDLRGADLARANLSGADFREADLDFSSWPLCCGSFDVRVDARIMAQMAYHFCRLECDDEEVRKAQTTLRDLANAFHRIKECGEIPSSGGEKVDF